MKNQERKVTKFVYMSFSNSMKQYLYSNEGNIPLRLGDHAVVEGNEHTPYTVTQVRRLTNDDVMKVANKNVVQRIIPLGSE